MSTWLAIFRAEFRRAAHLLPWVAILHVLMFCIRSGTGIQLSRRLAGLVEWGTVALAALIIVPSLWADSPFRHDRFLATRPAKPVPLHSAKLPALFILAGLPFIAVEFANLLAWGWSGKIVLLGTLQAIVGVVVVLLCACPLVWLWRGKLAGSIGTALMLAIASATILYAPRGLYFRHGSTWLASSKFAYPPVQLLTLAIVALLMAGLLLFPGRFRHLAKTLLFLPATCLSVLAVMWLCNRQPAPDPGETVPLALVWFNRQSKASDDLIGVHLPAPAPPPDVEAEWSLTKLVANGRDFTPWITPAVGLNDEYDSETPALQKALRLRYGASLQLPEPEASERRSPSHVLTSARDASGKMHLDLTVRQTLLGFEVAAELPLQAGASLHQGGLLWTIETYRGESFGRNDGTFARLSLRSPSIWLGSLEPEEEKAYRFFILYGDNRIKRLGRWMQGPSSARGKGGLRKFEIPLLDLGIRRESEWPAGARLVVVRPVVLSKSSYSWKSPGPVTVPQDLGGRHDKVPDPGPDAVLPWLKDHPAPAVTATGDQVSSWLAELMPRIPLTPPHRGSQDAGFQAAVAAVANLVPSHPDRVHEALEKLPDTRNGAKNVCWEAFIRSLQRDAVVRFPQLMEDLFIRYQYVRKGWAADVTPYEVKQARLGGKVGTIDLLLDSPEATGFSQAEWLALFRLYPEGHVFRALNGKVLPKPLLEEEADRLLATYLPSKRSSEFPHLINLALARGRSDAPAWLAAWLPRWRETGEINPRGVGMTLATYFVLPDSAKSGKAAVDWFVSQDPAAFRFDPASGKYQLP